MEGVVGAGVVGHWGAASGAWGVADPGAVVGAGLGAGVAAADDAAALSSSIAQRKFCNWLPEFCVNVSLLGGL